MWIFLGVLSCILLTVSLLCESDKLTNKLIDVYLRERGGVLLLRSVLTMRTGLTPLQVPTSWSAFNGGRPPYTRSCRQ